MFVHMTVGISAKEHRHAGNDYEDLSRCLDTCLLSDKGLNIHLELTNSVEQEPLYKAGINNKWLVQILNILQQLPAKKIGILLQKQGVIQNHNGIRKELGPCTHWKAL